MESISLDELFELYKDTINKCGTHLLNEDDTTIEYNIFEEFDIGVISFLHEENLKKLFDGGLISGDEINYSIKLREMVFNLQKGKEWNIEAFRTSDNWKQILSLSDKINSIRRK